jgi:hypothetical protein
MVGGVAVLVLISGAEEELAPGALSSATLKLMISTMLETSFLMFSGRLGGSCLPVSFKLHRYMASANSGK